MLEAMSLAEKNPMFRNRKIEDLPPLESNVYYQDNQLLFTELLKLVEAYPKSYTRKLEARGRQREAVHVRLPYKHIMDWIDQLLPMLGDSHCKTSTKVTWILRGLTQFPKCATCQRDDKMKLLNVNPFKGYPKHCDLKCSCSDQAVVTKSKATCKDKHGDANFRNPDKATVTLRRKQEEDPDYWSKRNAKSRKTCLDRYGVENPMQSDEVKETLKAKNVEKFGKEWYTETDEFLEKTKATNNENYGKDWFTQTDAFKESAKKTWMENLGVDCPSKSHDVIVKSLQRYVYDGKFFSSAPEVAFYIWLTDNKIPFVYQPDCDLTYEHDGKLHKYFPDFEVNGKLVELKGDQFLKEDGTWQNPFDHEQDGLYEAKHQCCIKNGVTVLFSKDYKKYLKYVKDKYGRDFLHSLKKQKKAQ